MYSYVSKDKMAEAGAWQENSLFCVANVQIGQLLGLTRLSCVGVHVPGNVKKKNPVTPFQSFSHFRSYNQPIVLLGYQVAH